MMNWFKNLKTTQKIVGLIILMGVFMSLVGFTGYYFNKKAGETVDSLYHQNLLSIQILDDMNIGIRANEKNLLHLMFLVNLSDREEHLNDIKTRASEVNTLLSEFEKMELNKSERESINKFKQELSEFRSVRDNIIQQVLNGKSKEAYRYYLDNEAVFNEPIKILDELAKYNEDEAKNANEQNEKDSRIAEGIIIVTIILALVFSFIIGLIIANLISKPLITMLLKVQDVAKGNLAIDEIKVKSKDEVGQLGNAFNIMTRNLRDLVTQVSKSVEEMSAGSEEMSAAADQTAQGSQQVATSVTQLAAGSQEQANNITTSLDNINQMNKAIQKISENSDNVVKLAESTESNANSGYNQAEKAINKINQIKTTSLKTSQTANKLSKLSAEIEQIVDLIKSIANQTNLLALNAAIEAARAGEHGKGFAVVADEVKKLATQSAEATNKITDMIKEIQNETNNVVVEMDIEVQEIEDGVSIIEEVGHSLSEILNVAKDVSNKVAEVSKVANNLTKDSDNVVRMMENISAITEESAASSEEIASITEEQTASVEEINASSQALAKIAETLNSQVSVFKI